MVLSFITDIIGSKQDERDTGASKGGGVLPSHELPVRGVIPTPEQKKFSQTFFQYHA